MWAKRTLALVPLAMLAACATNYPDLYSAQPPKPSAPPQNAEVDQVLRDAAQLQATYAGGYKASAQYQDYGQLPLIGAAAAAAFVLLANKTNAATTAGNIGIGAGAYTAVRGQLSAAGLADIYISGHGALSCVIAEGSYFSGDNASDLFTRQDTELTKIANAILVADLATKDFHYKDPTPAQNDALKAARSVADQAITQARIAETAALTQEAAFENAAPIFHNAVSSISMRVASKGRVRPAVDFAALRDSFSPPKAPTVVNAQSDEEKDVNDVIANIVTRTNGLVTETGRLIAATRPYSQSLARVAACPDQIH